MKGGVSLDLAIAATPRPAIMGGYRGWHRCRRENKIVVDPFHHDLNGQSTMNILAIDIGGTHIKLLRTGMQHKKSFDSGPTMTPEEMMRQIDLVKGDWDWDRVSIGFPAPCAKNRPMKEPTHLKDGWVDFDYEKALGCKVRLINDAAIQALGSYQGGKMLF